MCVICDGVFVALHECVEERGQERYCWRAGVMSRGEGEGQGVDRQPEEEGITVTSLFIRLLTCRSVGFCRN